MQAAGLEIALWKFKYNRLFHEGGSMSLNI